MHGADARWRGFANKCPAVLSHTPHMALHVKDLLASEDPNQLRVLYTCRRERSVDMRGHHFLDRAMINFWICQRKAPGSVNSYTSGGMRVKLLLRVACIDLWSHREGALGLSQMYLQCSADQSSDTCRPIPRSRAIPSGCGKCPCL